MRRVIVPLFLLLAISVGLNLNAFAFSRKARPSTALQQPTSLAGPSTAPTFTFEPDEAATPIPHSWLYRLFHSSVATVCNPYNRWPIKTLSDPNASLVNLNPQDTSIGVLSAIVRPSPVPLPSEYPDRISTVEFTTYHLPNVTLHAIYPPGSDRDYHLILQDGSGKQFIAESINPQCASGSAVMNQLQTVRSYIDSHWAVGTTVINPNVKIDITGVGFFDPYNGAEHPPSGLELHPILSITVVASPTPSPSPNTYYPVPTAAPTSLFYTSSGESGNVAQEMDPNATGALMDETLSYAVNPLNNSWGWITAPGEPGATSWPAAAYSVQLDITHPNAAIQISEVRIYRVDSTGGPRYVGLETVGFLSGLSQSLASAGVITFSVAGASQSASSSDRLAVKFYTRNTSSAGQSFSYNVGTGTSSRLVIQPNPSASP